MLRFLQNSQDHLEKSDCSASHSKLYKNMLVKNPKEISLKLKSVSKMVCLWFLLTNLDVY